MRFYGMKLRLLALAVVCMFVVATAPVARSNYDMCAAPLYSSRTCQNYMYFDQLVGSTYARYQNWMYDYFTASAPNQLYFTSTTWYPYVYAGNPTFVNYYVVDNTYPAHTVYNNSNYNGALLSSYSQIGLGLYVTTNYSPSYHSNTVLTTRNTTIWGCGFYAGCSTISQASDFAVQ